MIIDRTLILFSLMVRHTYGVFVHLHYLSLKKGVVPADWKCQCHTCF